MKIYNIKDKPQFIREVAELTQEEWGKKVESKSEFEYKVNRKIEKMNSMLDNPNFCILILLDEDVLVGFIAILPKDGDYRVDLTPWYGMMYVKEEFRGYGHSKILNRAILHEAHCRGFEKIYLKSDLVGYYEKFGAKYIETLSNGERLFYIEV